MTARPPIAQFGDAIAVEGVRPAWLPDELWDQVEATLYWGEVQQCILGETNPVMSDWEWPDIKFLKLPVPRYDFVYLALERGMVPWFGGDEAPGDCDETGQVLLRNGYTIAASQAFFWDHHKDLGNDIIGYTRKATSTALPLAHPAAPQGEEDANIKRIIAAAQRVVSDYPAAAGAYPDIEGGDSKPGWGSIRSLAEALAALAPAAIASGRGGACPDKSTNYIGDGQ